MLKQATLYLGIAVALLATSALAQPPQPPSAGPRSPAPQAAPSPPPPPAGPRREEGPLPPPSKAAHFRVEQGDNGIDVKCADDEPTRACADIAMQFLDRLGITQSRTTGSAPR